MFLVVFIWLNKDHAYGRQGCNHIQGIILSIIWWLQHWCMSKWMFKIIKHGLCEIIPNERGIFLDQPHETMCPFCIIADERRRNFSFPCKIWSSVMFVGVGRDKIASIFKGSIWMPSLETINPRSRPTSTQKTHLWGFRQILKRWHRRNIALRWSTWISHYLEWVYR